MRNIFAGSAGPRSIPPPLCPGTLLWQEPRSCPPFSLHTCALALSKPRLWKYRDAHSHYGGCGAARRPGQQKPALGFPCLTTFRCGCTLLGVSLPLHPMEVLGGELMKLGQSCPPFTCTHPSFKPPEAVASSVSDHTAAETLLPSLTSLPGSSHSEVNRSQHPIQCPSQGQDNSAHLLPAAASSLHTHPSHSDVSPGAKGL